MKVQSTIRRLTTAACFALALALLSVPSVAQQEGQDSSESQGEPQEEAREETRKERLKREKQERIDAYYARKAARQKEKAEKKAAREAEKARKQAEKESEAQRMAEEKAIVDAEKAQAALDAELQLDDDRSTRAASTTKMATLTRQEQKTAEAREAELAEEELELAKLPKKLAEVQANVRGTSLGQDPTVIPYLDKIDDGEASPQQIAAVANFIADAGLIDEAVVYYKVALSADKKDPLLWLNYGTLRRRQGDVKGAASAFARSLSIDPNNARAHYNLGAVLDEMGKYDDAVDEYKLALTLDPELGNPEVNPQAANNKRLVAVKLLLYRESDGGLVLPLSDVPKGSLER